MSHDRLIKYSFLAVAACVIAFLCYILIAGYYQKKREIAQSQETKALQEQKESLKRELANLEKELNDLKGQKSPGDRIEQVFGKGSSMLSLEEKNLTFKEVELLVMSFFSYLDGEGYVEKNKLTGSAYSQYETMEKDLSACVPVISGETENLYNLVQNTAHFSRVLGKQRLYLVRDVLTEESDIIEFGMKTFFIWYTYENENGKRMRDQPSLKVLYDYAGFFLGSLGGKSYLSRRDSRIRILTSFYSVLIIDIANDRNLNSNGLDIRPCIKATFDDITDYMGLFDKMEYLDVLEKLKTKYNMP
jgi:hypothetical protein